MAAALVAGCAANQKLMGEPVRKPVAILVHISDEVNEADHAGGVAELVTTLQDGLKDEGIESEIFARDDDHPPAPRIELNVTYWSETSQTSRDMVAAGTLVPVVGIAGAISSAANRMDADCTVVLEPDERRVFAQQFTAYKGMFGGGEAAAGRTMAHFILQKILLTHVPPKGNRGSVSVSATKH